MMAGIRCAVVQGHVWEFEVFWDSCFHDLPGEWILFLAGAIFGGGMAGFTLDIGLKF